MESTINNRPLSDAEQTVLAVAYAKEWFVPRWHWGRVADRMVKAGIMERHIAARYGGEAYRLTDMGRGMCDAAMSCQVHECPSCGERNTFPENYRESPRCSACDSVMWPMWGVVDSRGRVFGEVAGGSEYAAMESAKQSPKFAGMHAFTVRPLRSIRALTAAKV